MVAVAQLVEHLIVVQAVVGSSPIGHPNNLIPPFFYGGFIFTLEIGWRLWLNKADYCPLKFGSKKKTS